MAESEPILVLGVSGLLGRYIAKMLVDQGRVVSVLDIVQRYEDIPFYSGDISDSDVVLSAIRKSGATCVFHTVSPLATEGESEEFWKVNVEGTKKVVSACIDAGVRKLVYTSSSGVIFGGTPVVNADETHPIPKTRKGLRAYHPKLLLKKWSSKQTEKTAYSHVLFARAVYSGIPGDRATLKAMWTQYQKGNTGVQMGDNKNLVDWTSVQNAADAHILAAKHLDSPIHPDAPVAGETFFVTNGDPKPFWNFANAVWDRFDAYCPGKRTKKKPIVIPEWLGLILGSLLEFHGWIVGKKPIMTRYVVLLSTTPRHHNISKAKRAFGYVPKVGLDEELDNMVKWWMEHKGKEN